MIDYLQAAREVAIHVAEDAGKLIRAGAEQSFSVWRKSDRDLVTELDYAAEQLIIERLRSSYPSHHVVSEESGMLVGDSYWSWLIDPLDGTNNIALGLAAYAVGLTLCDGEVPVVAVVHDPISGRTWSAVRGQGAYVGRERLRRRPRNDGRDILAWTQGYQVNPDDPIATALKLQLDRKATRVVRLWAPLVAWVMLARGDLGGFVGYRVGELDLHGGALIATEAGLQILDPSGTPFDSTFKSLDENRSFIAGTSDRLPGLIDLWSSAEEMSGRMDGLWAGSPAAGDPT
ncbi:inositol monophosphatase family protein [Herbidospora sp. RD11066]